MWLLIVAAIGFVFGNGLFVYWLLFEFDGLAALWANHLALAFIVDALITLVVLTVLFAQQPPGPVRWPWFLVLSVAGGLCFGLPFYCWLNARAGSPSLRAPR